LCPDTPYHPSLSPGCLHNDTGGGPNKADGPYNWRSPNDDDYKLFLAKGERYSDKCLKSHNAAAIALQLLDNTSTETELLTDNI
jgi:hypothetical protein